MENKYKIIQGAATEYLRGDFTDNNTAKFIAKSEGRKVFLHEIAEDEDFIYVSQYEKTEKHKLPILLLEEYQEEDENILEKEERENIKFQMPTKAKKALYIILSMIMVNISIYYTISQIAPSFASSETTIENTGSGQTLFDTYTDRIITLEKKENLELTIQKDLRAEKAKEIERLDTLIANSVESVKVMREEKTEIERQKIELAQ